MKISTIALIIVGAIALNGCGSDEPYQEVKKDEKMVSVQNLKEATTDTSVTNAQQTTATSLSELAVKQPERLFLYTRSLGDAPRYSAPIHGFSQGDEKLVTLRMTENGIQLRQIDRDNIGLGHDSRYDNEYNKAPVLTIPGEYVDFQCQKDNWDDCTNKEEEITDRNVTWDQKKFFIPHFEAAQIAEENYTDLVTFKQCTTETESAHLVKDGDWHGYEMDLANGVINFEIEHTYQANPACFGKFFKGNFDNLSFTTTEYISIVAVDQLASDDFDVVPYSEDENSSYGFFRTQHNYRDGNHAAGKDGYVRQYLNHYNPKKAAITYYLSNNFFEDKNKPFLDAANESITAMNIQNKMFETGLPPIKLEKAGNHRHGDLRYSNITLFDEPLDNGLAGYGPSAANPLTGEIVSGRVDQYSANLEQGATRYYRRVQLDYNRGMLDPSSVKALTGVDYTPAPEAIARDNEVAANKLVAQQTATSDNSMSSQPMQTELPQAQIPTLSTDNADSAPFEELVNQHDKTADFWAEHNLMSVNEAFGLGGGALRELPRGLKGHEIDWTNSEFWVDGIVGEKLKDIEKMSTSFQSDLVTKLAAQAFAGTLTHELGHTFGLRHNFAGSRDQANFFNEQEISKFESAFAAAGYPNLTVKADFSSQMDYNVDRFATTFEKYDLAALRFGYARNVETTDGAMVSLKEQDANRRQELSEGDLTGATQYGALHNVAAANDLRYFAFCTDGHVSLNSNCNRFDAGTNNDDIAQYYVDKYFDSYDTMNLRHNRQTLFEDNILPYTVNRLSGFNDIRQFVEDTASAEELFAFSQNDLAEFCPSHQTYWFCASQRAVNKAADTFLKVAGMNDIYLHVSYKMNSDDSTVFTKVHSLEDLLSRIYRLNGNQLDESLDVGKIITSFEQDPEKLKQLLVKADVVSAYQDLLYADVTVNKGRLLNGLKAPESNPNHPFVNERDVLGMWPDKLLAVRQLLTRKSPRSSTDRSYYALADTAKVHDDLQGMLCHMTMGNTVDDLNGYLTTPALNNACADVDPKYYSSDVDYADQQIEALPSYATSLGSYFGFPQSTGEMKGKSNLLQMMLKQVVLASHDSDYRGEEKARVWREFAGIHMASDAVSSVKTISLQGKNYVATDENTLALALIEQLEQIDTLMENKPLMDHVMNADGATFKDLIVDPMVARDKRVLTYLPVLS
ncbi:zinc-dependent metalloprotease [Shewanella sp. 10N.7]|uniref:zinc-dependent metalloprotease n=1 Tax=Shewanella sp. 10N.7 TaxID=2885093 RepID=UPI001E366C63|nr:zinc-dependent metalloprotease [Shewanella sp. 10N.7]MCC4834827.1 zinc-dependent metalloprotease [Shewanella sp. 10N.7]